MGHAPSALALAWLLGKGLDLVAIPGTRSVDHLEENLSCHEIQLMDSDITAIEQVFPDGFPFGARYP